MLKTIDKEIIYVTAKPGLQTEARGNIGCIDFNDWLVRFILRNLILLIYMQSILHRQTTEQ